MFCIRFSDTTKMFFPSVSILNLITILQIISGTNNLRNKKIIVDVTMYYTCTLKMQHEDFVCNWRILIHCDHYDTQFYKYWMKL